MNREDIANTADSCSYYDKKRADTWSALFFDCFIYWDASINGNIQTTEAGLLSGTASFLPQAA
jgi:hypothetical protein